MGAEIPTWVTKDFIKRALTNKEKNDNEVITVDEYDVIKPIAKGDNYVCDILRATVTYRKTSSGDSPLKTSLIIKSPINSGMHGAIQKMGLLKKETRVYTEFLPRMNKLLGASKAISADCYYCDDNDVIVLEDLKPKGYVMADRRNQLDYEHCIIALKALAKFHAASVKIHEEDPVTVEQIGIEAFFNQEIHAFNHYFAGINFKLLAKECEKIPELKRYVEQLNGYADQSWELLVEMVKSTRFSFNVLNHGDFWVNNMLFRYENNAPVGVYIMDYQVCRYTSPAFDLHYFLYGSVKEEVRLKRRDDLLTEYLAELNLNLELFGTTKRLDKAELNTMMEETEFFAMLTTFSLFPIIISDPKDGVMELGQLSEKQFKDLDNNPMGHYYKNKTFLGIIEKRLAEFEKKGWF